MAKKKQKYFTFLVLIKSLLLALVLFMSGTILIDAIKGQTSTGKVAQIDRGRYSHQHRIAYYDSEIDKTVAFNSGLNLLQYNENSDVSVTQNGKSYRVGTRLHLIIRSLFWSFLFIIIYIHSFNKKKSSKGKYSSKYTAILWLCVFAGYVFIGV